MLTALGTILSVFSCMPALGAVYEFAPPPPESHDLRVTISISILWGYFIWFLFLGWRFFTYKSDKSGEDAQRWN